MTTSQLYHTADLCWSVIRENPQVLFSSIIAYDRVLQTGGCAPLSTKGCESGKWLQFRHWEKHSGEVMLAREILSSEGNNGSKRKGSNWAAAVVAAVQGRKPGWIGCQGAIKPKSLGNTGLASYFPFQIVAFAFSPLGTVTQVPQFIKIILNSNSFLQSAAPSSSCITAQEALYSCIQIINKNFALDQE